jgi:DNA-binding HxlR family transcriptional regulator
MCGFLHVASFSRFRQHAGMSTDILADRLARLTAAGILQAEGIESQRRGGYRLTGKGSHCS